MPEVKTICNWENAFATLKSHCQAYANIVRRIEPAADSAPEIFCDELIARLEREGVEDVGGFLAWLSHRWPEIAYRHTFYRVDPQGIEIRRGVVWRRTINVPKSRVQHTDVSQGPLQRTYALGTLVVYTAGTDHAKVELPGLSHARAMRIRDHLLPSGGDDAV